MQHLLLEESKLILMENMAQYQGIALHVIENLNACFADVEYGFNWSFEG